MASARDLTGQRFGRLVALQPTEKRKNRYVIWECQCDCGNIVYVRSANLTNRHTNSCGCLWREDLIGQRFGKLVAIRPTEERQNGSVVWECQCDCGNIAFVRRANLVNGNTRSCGCLKSKNIDLTGQRFGKLIALRPTEERQNGSVMWECKCDCGNIVHVRRANLVNGRTRSCGCLGRKDLTSRRFGKLVALRPTEGRKNGSVMWECRCDCGNTISVRSGHLTGGHTQSCGCSKTKQ